MLKNANQGSVSIIPLCLVRFIHDATAAEPLAVSERLETPRIRLVVTLEPRCKDGHRSLWAISQDKSHMTAMRCP
jgi:hypothetical protein